SMVLFSAEVRYRPSIFQSSYWRPLGAPSHDMEPALGSCGAFLRKPAGSLNTFRVVSCHAGPVPIGLIMFRGVTVTPDGKAAPPICRQFSEPVPLTKTVVHGFRTPVFVQ